MGRQFRDILIEENQSLDLTVPNQWTDLVFHSYTWTIHAWLVHSEWDCGATDGHFIAVVRIIYSSLFTWILFVCLPIVCCVPETGVRDWICGGQRQAYAQAVLQVGCDTIHFIAQLSTVLHTAMLAIAQYKLAWTCTVWNLLLSLLAVHIHTHTTVENRRQYSSTVAWYASSDVRTYVWTHALSPALLLLGASSAGRPWQPAHLQPLTTGSTASPTTRGCTWKRGTTPNCNNTHTQHTR